MRAFLDDLSKSAKAKVYAAIEKLAQRGNRLGMPKGLHELRIAHPEGPFRIIYCFVPARRAMLLHAFVKRTEATPKQELELARQRQPD
ncbi:MAG: type II toxin-antitoxin system RelE/ParE family toxin [Candidatus Rokubacteria bacterium]|nr:type II toxin-antitoxin system RelE/ParE family toxin [Candidatus Rokubacteria bacterium]MBI2014357.1 type II toxin-antitoxin system RelE/ParE family toxin [Candidatus Rokubacteria bacterium]